VTNRYSPFAVRCALLLIFALTLTFPAFAQDPQPGSPGVGDSLYPGFGNGGYDVQHYTLDLIVDPASSFIVGETTIEATATQDLSAFNLDLIGLEVGAITVDGEPAEFSREGQELTITPAAPIRSGAEFVTVISYTGVPENIYSVAIPVLTGWVFYGDGIFVLSEPDGAANFYPVNDHPLDKATYTLRVTVPKPYSVAMNGIVTEITDNGDTTTTVSEVNHPMASYLTTINIAQFELVEDGEVDGVPIRNYFDVGLSDAGRANFARQAEMMVYFESLFGDYPFDVYGSVVLNTETGTALETQTLSIFGIDMIDENDPLAGESTVAHEIVHQWFGNSVTLADWRDIWLHEAWGTYGEGLWIEYNDGRAALDSWIHETYAYISEQVEFLSPPGSPPADDLFNTSVYYWGALALHALRVRVGGETFFQIAREWHARYQYGNAGTAEFIDVVNDITGQDYTAFFESWLYSGDLPAIPEMALGS